MIKYLNHDFYKIYKISKISFLFVIILTFAGMACYRNNQMNIKTSKEYHCRHAELVLASPANDALMQEIAGQARNDEREAMTVERTRK